MLAIVDGESQSLAADVRCFSLKTPTLPPATATNTLLFGTKRLVVVEPACPYPEGQAVLERAIEARCAKGAALTAIVLSHHHRDHIGHAERLRARFGAPLMAHPETAARLVFEIDRPLDDGDVVSFDEGRSLTAFFTPGHAPGHLVLRDAEAGVVYAGDMIAGEGTILIEPEDGGDMRAYLRSLERLRDDICGPNSVLVPSHGPVIERPGAACTALIAHRHRRERKVLDALEGGALHVEALLARVYDDTPRALWPLAARALEAHLQKLYAEGRAALQGGRVRATADPGEHSHGT